ncbi:MAG: sugar transferase [Solirubrobacteraceae bacterium]
MVFPAAAFHRPLELTPVEPTPALRGRGQRLAISLLEERRWRTVRIAADLLMLVLAGVIATLVSAPATAELPLLAFPPLTFALLHHRGHYRRHVGDAALDRIGAGVGAISIGSMSVFMLTLLTVGNSQTTSSLIAHSWLASVLLVSGTGTLLTLIETAARTRRVIEQPTLIVGADKVGCDVVERLRHHPEYGLRPVGFLDRSPLASIPADMPPVLGTLADLAATAKLHGIRHVIVGFPHADELELERLVGSCGDLGLGAFVIPRLASTINEQTHCMYLGAVPVLSLQAVNPAGLGLAAKYLLDRVIAALMLLILCPLMLASALAVRLSSPGPILFRQLRTGQDDEIFELLKFRTMLAATPGEAFAPHDDLAPGGVEGIDRRTGVGRVLRRTSLDELPQLFNVLRGSMSIIGPRPERPELAEEFRERFGRYHDRQRVRSGITGWAQVHGSRGQTPMADRIELDNFYIEHRSLRLDAKILFRTIPALFKGS